MNMTTLPIGRYRFFQKIQPLFLLSKMASKPTTGCWQVYSPSASWLIYMEEGKLIYASYVDKMFDIIYKSLQRLSKQIPTLHNGVDKQLQAIFENKNDVSLQNLDYLAICWLVNEKYINSAEAGILIEQLALEILQPFLSIEEGSYEFIPDNSLGDMPRFCHLDLLSLIEQCQQAQKPRETKPSTIEFLKAKARKYQTKIEQKFTRQNGYKIADYSQELIFPKLGKPDNKEQQKFQQQVEEKLYKIICIDDSPIVISAVQNFLDEQIFSVIGVNDPLKALIQIIRIKPDIILLDIEMPNLDGYEICSLLRKHSHFQDTPVIMITGRTGFIDKAKAKMVKATGYLTKPFTQVDLLKILFQYIK